MPKWFGGSALNPDGIIPKDKQWQIQWDRVTRYFERSILIKMTMFSGRQGLTKFEIDDLITFFLHAYHLKDWIKSCRPDQKEKLSVLFSNFEMQCCRDLANGFKHKKLINPSVDADFNFYREFDCFALEKGNKNTVLFRIAFEDKNHNIKKFDTFELIQTVYKHWKDFIKKNLIDENK